MKLLVAVDVALVVLALAAWLVLRTGGDERENVVNDGLRGSRPPAGQAWPDELASIPGIRPPVPRRSGVVDAPTVLVATCIECRSGDILGGFLGRLGEDALPDSARVHVVTWDGDPGAWARQWNIDTDRIVLHDADGRAADPVRARLGIGSIDGADESGVTLVFDPRGRWRASYSIGQLQADDLAHDLRALGAGQ